MEKPIKSRNIGVICFVLFVIVFLVDTFAKEESAYYFIGDVAVVLGAFALLTLLAGFFVKWMSE